jgi:fido (protein-threonine AMPylation protein)
MEELSSSIPEVAHVAITKWPNYLYGEAFPGAAFPEPITESELISYQERAFTITLEQAEKEVLDESIRVQLDWVFALLNAKKTLLVKPIEQWTVDDICLLSSWITRLTAKNPGKFRSEGVCWNLKEFSAEELRTLNAIEAKMAQGLSLEEIDFYKTCCYNFIDHEDIKRALSDLLTFIKQEMEDVQLLPANKRKHRFIKIGALMHLEIVKIHPFEEGAKRLGRLMMYIAWCQKGIEPVTFFDKTYGDKLIDALTKQHSVFFNYVAGRYYVCAVLRPLPFYYEVLRDIGKKLDHEKADFKEEFFKHPLFQAYVAQRNGSLTFLDGPVSNDVEIVKICQNCHSKPKSGEELKRCGRCKSAFYCSVDCQKADWRKGHQKECVKK